MRKRIFSVLVILWMIVIFVFSGRDATQSTEDSYTVGMFVGEIVVEGFSELPETEKYEFAASVDHPIRKCAHALEYAVLGALLVGALYDYKCAWYRRLLFPWIIAILYAGTDEFHQRFVAGRSCQFTDVIIDGCGALVGIICMNILVCVIMHIIKTRKSKRN